jgi:hypothetical protein
MEVSASRPGRFTPRERALSIHCIGVWVGPRASLNVVAKRKKSHHYLQQELNFGHPAHSLVSILAELSRPLCVKVLIIIIIIIIIVTVVVVVVVVGGGGGGVSSAYACWNWRILHSVSGVHNN